MSGCVTVGLVRPKTPSNIGSILRAAYCFRANMVAIENARVSLDHEHVRRKMKIGSTDTNKAWRHMPVIQGDLKKLIPHGAVPVAIDLVDDAIPLQDFVHPKSAFYIFGPEDGTLGKSHLEWCGYKVMIPTRRCLNLAATVNVVLYDRMAKAVIEVKENGKWVKEC